MMMHFRLQYSMSLWNIKIQITYEFLYLMIVKNLFNSQQCLNGSKVKCHSQTIIFLALLDDFFENFLLTGLIK